MYAEGTAQLPPDQSDIPHPDALRQLPEGMERRYRPFQPCSQEMRTFTRDSLALRPANATPHWRRALGVAYVADGTLLYTHPPGFSGAAGATMRATTLRTLFGPNAEGQAVQGSRHPRL